MADAAGNMQYFVNEVERGLTISFFSVIESGTRALRVADELGPLMVEWIKRRVAVRAGERPIVYKTKGGSIGI
jgi:hypothetical protein